MRNRVISGLRRQSPSNTASQLQAESGSENPAGRIFNRIFKARETLRLDTGKELEGQFGNNDRAGAISKSVMPEQSLLKTVTDLSGERAEYQKKLSKIDNKGDLLPFVDSYVNGDRLEFSLAAAEFMRVVEAIVTNTQVENTPFIGGLFLPEDRLTVYAEVLSHVADILEDEGYDPTTLDDLQKNLLKTAEVNGTVLMGVDEEAMEHEFLHQRSYLGAARKELAHRYKNLRDLAQGTDKISELFRAAFNAWAGLEMRNWKLENASDYELGHAAEEIFTYIATDKFETIGIESVDDAAILAVELGERYAAARIEENPKLSVGEALLTFKDTRAVGLLTEVNEVQDEGKFRTENKRDRGGIANQRIDERDGRGRGSGTRSDERSSQSSSFAKTEGETSASVLKSESGTEGRGLKQHRPALSAEKAGTANDEEKGELTPNEQFAAENPETGNTVLKSSQIPQPTLAELDSRMSRAIEDFKAGDLEPEDKIPLSPRTFAVYRKLGAPNLPMRITASLIDKATNGARAGHDISLNSLAKLPSLLARPVMVLDSAEKGNLIAVVELVDGVGKPVVAVVHINRLIDRDKVNFIPTINGKSNISQITDWIERGRLRYYDTKKMPGWATRHRLQLPDLVQTARQANPNLLTEKDFVNKTGKRIA